MSNILPAHKVEALRDAFEAGVSTRRAAQLAKVAKNTAFRYRAQMRDATPCKCGRPAGHRGWCATRYAASTRRQAVLSKMWHASVCPFCGRGLTENQTGHTRACYERVLPVPPNEYLIEARTRRGWKVVRTVRTFGGGKTAGTQWFNRHRHDVRLVYRHTVLREWSVKEKQWRHANRELRSVRKWLRDLSPSAPKGSRPAQTSPQ